jgi:hypothetical protein
MALGDGERDLRRYNLSALIVDLVGNRVVAETFALASDVFHETADLFPYGERQLAWRRQMDHPSPPPQRQRPSASLMQLGWRSRLEYRFSS